MNKQTRQFLETLVQDAQGENAINVEKVGKVAHKYYDHASTYAEREDKVWGFNPDSGKLVLMDEFAGTDQWEVELSELTDKGLRELVKGINHEYLADYLLDKFVKDFLE